MVTPWPENSPDSLEEISLLATVKSIHTFTERIHGELRLKKGISLQHPSLCDKIFQNFQEEYSDLFWLPIFKDNSVTRLNKVSLPWQRMEGNTLQFLSFHPVKELDLSHCDLAESCVQFINKLSKTLVSLKIDDAYSLVESLIEYANSNISSNAKAKQYCVDYVFDCPQLKRLVLRDACFEETENYDAISGHNILAAILCPLKNLTHLDLSSCVIQIEMMDCLEELPNLLFLNLSDISFENMLEALENICKAKKLRHLNISGSEENPSYHKDSESCMRYIAENLPGLTSLDISATNLGGVDRYDKNASGDGYMGMCSIPGLEGKQLEFLGLLDCPDNPCERNNIPAKRVTGSHNEKQILLSLKCYMDKGNTLASALNHLFHLLRYEEVEDQCQALELVLMGMKNNNHDKQVQISGSAALFYIFKGSHKEKVTQKQRRRLMLILLDALENFKSDKTGLYVDVLECFEIALGGLERAKPVTKLVRNCLLNFCSLNLPENLNFCIHRIAKCLIDIVMSDNQEEFILRLGIILLNCIACQVDGEEKLTFGDLGAIEAMLKIIRRKIALSQCDENMEVSWSMMWNITDETAQNCKRFIDNDGMELFSQCLEKFPDNEELLRNMMGLMGNIAEVRELRAQLMNRGFLTVFSDLMESKKDGIEVSYNAVGIFSHMTADGAKAWTVQMPSREEVMRRMIRAIETWPLDSKRNINYRSFGPILNLLKAYDTPAAQNWAVWALCNLTQVYPERYCRLLKNEGGLEILQQVIEDHRPLANVKILARQVIEQVIRKRKPDDSVDQDEMQED